MPIERYFTKIGLALCVLTTSSKGIYGIIKTKCYVYTRDNSDNVTNIIKDLHSQMEAMSSLDMLLWEQLLSSCTSG